jgi:hypothetical protein
MKDGPSIADDPTQSGQWRRMEKRKKKTHLPNFQINIPPNNFPFFISSLFKILKKPDVNEMILIK